MAASKEGSSLRSDTDVFQKVPWPGGDDDLAVLPRVQRPVRLFCASCAVRGGSSVRAEALSADRERAVLLLEALLDDESGGADDEGAVLAEEVGAEDRLAHPRLVLEREEDGALTDDEGEAGCVRPGTSVPGQVWKQPAP